MFFDYSDTIKIAFSPVRDCRQRNIKLSTRERRPGGVVPTDRPETFALRSGGVWNYKKKKKKQLRE